MSSKRLNKRQLREQQELEALEGVPPSSGGGVGAGDRNTARQSPHSDDESVSQESDEGEATAPQRGASSAGGIFAQLAGAQGGEDGEDDDEDEDAGEDINSAAPAKSKSKNRRRKNKKKTKAAAEATLDPVGNVAQVPVAETPSTLQPDDSSAQADADHGKATKKKAKKPKAASQAAGTASTGKKGADKRGVSDMSMDEFSALLASQVQLNSQTTESAGKDLLNFSGHGPLSDLRSLLALSAHALDPAVELKRQFGAAAIKAYENEAGGGRASSNSSASTSARARAQAWNPNFKVRNILVQPQDTWPPIARTFTGMSMEVMDLKGQIKVGGWVHSRAYRKAQMEFLQAVHSYEPNHLMAMLRMYPWHIDTLLQLSDVSRHQGDLGQASDFNARALFAFERTAAPIFTSSLTSHLGPPMLDFKRIEDRGFWLASHRNVNFLGRRGTWRTSLEWVKLILGLDPAVDHHGMLLWIDFLSIKSRQHAWFLKALRALEATVAADHEQEDVPIANAKTPFDEVDKPRVGEGDGCRGALDWYAGLAYTKALALRAGERERGVTKPGNENESTAALRLAIARHPQVLVPLLDKIGAPMPTEVPRSHALLALETDEGDTMPQLLTHIYVARSESLWREPGMSSWLTSTLRDSWPVLEAAYSKGTWSRSSAMSELAREGIYRHVLVSDLPDTLRQTLIGLMPKTITSDSGMLNAFDPIPPQGEGASTYDDAYFAPVAKHRRGADDDEDLHGNAMRDDIVNRMITALRWVPGMDGLARAFENGDDGMREDIFRQLLESQAAAQAARPGPGPERMPGGLGDGDEEYADADADDPEGNDEIGDAHPPPGSDPDPDPLAPSNPGQARFADRFQGVFGRFFGGHGDAAGSQPEAEPEDNVEDRH